MRANLSRRAFLGGGAALVSLPLLPSLVPRSARAESTPPVRMVWFFIPNGVVMDDWLPVVEGDTWLPGPTLSPLADLVGEVSVVSGLQNNACVSVIRGAHSQGTAGTLTCVPPHFPEVWIGQSCDQVAARKTRELTIVPSLQVSGEVIRYPSCEQQYPCDYMTSISWETADRPLLPIANPVILFDQLVAGLDLEASTDERARRRARRSSVLDYVLTDAARAQGLAAADDKQRLEEYLDGLRELERRVELFALASTCDSLVSPGEATDPTERIDLISDLVVQALLCDRTRIVSYMLAQGQSKRDMSFLGYPGEHHVWSHHMDDPELMNVCSDINRWEVEVFADLLRKLRDTPEGEGTLLDSCGVQLTSELSNGNAHDHINLPVLLAGRAGGAFVPGRHITATDQPLAALHLAMIQAVDPTVRQFAEARLPLGGL